MSTLFPYESFGAGDTVIADHVKQLFQPIKDLEEGQAFFRSDIGTTNAYKVNFDGTGTGNKNAISAYAAGQLVMFKAANANTSSSTLQVVGPSGALSAVPLVKPGNVALVADDIKADQMVLAVYNDEGYFEMVGDGGGGSGGSGSGVSTYCKVVRTSNGSASAANTWHGISWQSALLDTDSFWDSGTPTEIVVPEGGLYAWSFTIGIGGTGDNAELFGRVNVNSTALMPYGYHYGASLALTATGLNTFSANDVLTVEWKSTTANKFVVAENITTFILQRVG